MSNIDKQALRGQSVEGSFYLVECCNCGEMYPSNLLDGGEAIADSGDYGDCYCHLCGADDTERADWGDVNSNEAKAWNFQQKRIEALLDELAFLDKRNAELNSKLERWAVDRAQSASDLDSAEKRIAELERKEQHSDRQSVIDALAGSGEEWSDIEEYMQKWDAERAAAAGKGERA